MRSSTTKCRRFRVWFVGQVKLERRRFKPFLWFGSAPHFDEQKAKIEMQKLAAIQNPGFTCLKYKSWQKNKYFTNCQRIIYYPAKTIILSISLAFSAYFCSIIWMYRLFAQFRRWSRQFAVLRLLCLLLVLNVLFWPAYFTGQSASSSPT